MTVSTVSILGLGTMGTAIADAFLQKGHTVTVWNRTEKKAGPLAEKGALASKCPESCMRSSSLTIIALLSDDIVRKVLSTCSNLAGCTIVNLTGSTPGQAKATSQIVHDLGASGYLHGFIGGFPEAVRAGAGTVFYSGPQKIFDTHQAMLKVLGDARWLSDQVQQASYIDNATLMMIVGTCGGFLQAMALVRAAGLDEAEFATQLVPGAMEAFAGWLLRLAEQVKERSYLPVHDGSVDLTLVATRNAVETAESLGVSTQIIQGMRDLMEKTVEEGRGHEEISVLVENLRNESNDDGR
ncbi:hypothetical protein FE257_008122 [Aspergillus nanangensis]|uniref:6-phosphogluconate dehydrogenase NADP-binding domain-containing protein n=1 Tax=Aspergillus nanangensis TaxID=2582783 RepID=A0AAD4CMH1_ASPNN|nr:hypothetical protein FE257_008122 [Aspergillus nanangensis]